MSAKKSSQLPYNILVISLISAVVGSLLTLVVIKKHFVLPYASTNTAQPTATLDPSTYEGYTQLVDQISFYGDWPRYQMWSANFSFEYPPEINVHEETLAATLKMKAYEKPDSQPAESSPYFYSISMRQGPLLSLQNEMSGSSLSDSSSHTEKFGDNTFYITKSKFVDGPCAGNYTFRAILPYKRFFIVVDDDLCSTVKGSDRRFFERFLSSFKIED